MAKEIERKFLIKDNSFVELATKSVHIRQAYLSDRPEATVRLRVAGQHAYITVKSKNHGATRDEWEYEIPIADAEQMASTLCGGWAIDKSRHIVPIGGLSHARRSPGLS
ncbi:MAG: CYTH domain-containing protein, partial [Duncaniella sp.]|nr:CYTH domain-containing protein [Duncaniella sp.]